MQRRDLTAIPTAWEPKTTETDPADIIRRDVAQLYAANQEALGPLISSLQSGGKYLYPELPSTKYHVHPSTQITRAPGV